MRARTICILGGSGFVGQHLANRLARDGRRIKVLTRRRERNKDLLVIPTLDLIEANVYDRDVLTRHFRGCDAVINLVGILNERGFRGKGFKRAHVELTDRVLKACRDAGVPRLLHMSALNADVDAGPSHYLRTKGEAENLVHHAGDLLAVTSFQPSVIFGPGGGFFNRFAGLLALSPGVFPLACPDARFAPVYVGDVAEAFVTALDNRGTFGARYQLCGPRTYTLRELVTYTAEVCRLRRVVIGLPDWLSRLQAMVLSFVPGKPFSLDNFRSLSVDSICTSDGLGQLGIKATPVEAVVPLYLGKRQYRSQYNRYRQAARRGG